MLGKDSYSHVFFVHIPGFSSLSAGVSTPKVSCLNLFLDAGARWTEPVHVVFCSASWLSEPVWIFSSDHFISAQRGASIMFQTAPADQVLSADWGKLLHLQRSPARMRPASLFKHQAKLRAGKLSAGQFLLCFLTPHVWFYRCLSKEPTPPEPRTWNISDHHRVVEGARCVYVLRCRCRCGQLWASAWVCKGVWEK